MQESVFIGVREFDSGSFPTTIDSKDGSYHIYYRTEK